MKIEELLPRSGVLVKALSEGLEAGLMHLAHVEQRHPGVHLRHRAGTRREGRPRGAGTDLGRT